MYNYGYFPTYTTMLPIYQTVLGNYGIGGSSTQGNSSRNNGMTTRIVSLTSSLLPIRRRLIKVLL